MAPVKITPQEVLDAPLPYLLYTPDIAKDAPVVLFLHGSGERGSDLVHVGDEGLPEILANLPEAAVVIAPQCPENSRWTEHLEELEKILDEVTARYAADPKRVYLTGLSLGGQGTWYLAVRYPERFAALVPVCGRSNPEEARQLVNLPTWVFHGADDAVVPPEESEKMVRALKEAGGHAKLTVYPNVGHNSWSRAYSESDLYAWLFTQRQGQPEL